MDHTTADHVALTSFAPRVAGKRLFDRSPATKPFEFILAALVTTLCVLCGLATLIVIFSDTPPVVNQQVRFYLLVNVMIMAGLVSLLTGLCCSFLVLKIRWIRTPILLASVFLLTLDGLLGLFDTQVLSVKGSPLPTALYNVNVGDSRLYLPQPTEMSRFGFRQERPETLDHTGLRILFLGNSYVHGSGSALASNYPQAVEHALRQRFPGRNISVFSGGVDGYGTYEDLALYQYLLGLGYKFDAVVLSFMMGSDPTNDIPGTIRQSIAGQAQRVHENWFLRTFYPFNSYLSRYLLYLYVTFNQTWGAPSDNAGSACEPTPGFAAFSRDRALDYYGPGARQRLPIDFNLKAVTALGRLADENGAQFFTVLLPDPHAVLPYNRHALTTVPMDWDWTRNAVLSQLGNRWPLRDLSPDFAGETSLFRCNDTHWNDAGNVEGANLVAAFLGDKLK